jgi:hypothetical protein
MLLSSLMVSPLFFSSLLSILFLSSFSSLLCCFNSSSFTSLYPLSLLLLISKASHSIFSLYFLSQFRLFFYLLFSGSLSCDLHSLFSLVLPHHSSVSPFSLTLLLSWLFFLFLTTIASNLSLLCILLYFVFYILLLLSTLISLFPHSHVASNIITLLSRYLPFLSSSPFFSLLFCSLIVFSTVLSSAVSFDTPFLLYSAISSFFISSFQYYSCSLIFILTLPSAKLNS